MKLLVILFALTCVFLSLGDIPSDQVKFVPGLKTQPNYKIYSGMILVNETKGRYLHYIFVESKNNPKTDPVFLWTNGGPGCSSWGGFLQEHGPFLNDNDGNVYENKWSWNNLVNMIYVEQPAGVGFSYSNDTSDYSKYNDHITSQDMNIFARKFFSSFPEFLNNPIYISGESYGGHYVPTISEAIYDGNLKGQQPKIPLKGFLVGNGISDDEEDGNSLPMFLTGHSIVPVYEYEAAFEACKGNFYKNAHIPECATYLSKIHLRLKHYDMYDVFDECFQDPFSLKNGGDIRQTRSYKRWEYFNQVEKISKKLNIHPLFALNRIPNEPYLPPCVSISSSAKYLNREDVKKEFHVRHDLKWEICNNRIAFTYDWTYKTMLPIYEKLGKAGMKLLHYSGDVDAAVNGLGTQKAMKKLADTTGQKVLKEWQNWMGDDGLVAGNFVKYERVTYVTVRGAGHMVPTKRPQNSLLLLKKYLSNEF